MSSLRCTWLAVVLAVISLSDNAHGQRERTRPRPRGPTSITESQAAELTLTLTEAAVRPIQVWVRTAGPIDSSRSVVTATLGVGEGAHLKVGQRVRAFSPQSRTRMHQGTVSRVVPRDGGVGVTVMLVGRAVDASSYYVLEIVTEHGDLLSVPNEAVLESAVRPVVYVQQSDGSYERREVVLGVRGELFTEVREGLKQGEQVVTIGSFFIDAEHRLKVF